MPRAVPTLATTLALVAACSAPEPARVPVRSVPPGSVRVERPAFPDGERLVVHVHTGGDDPPAVAELRGAWLDTGDGGRVWPIAGWTDGPDGMVGRCASPPDHDLRIVVRTRGEQRLHVVVEDRVGVRVAVTGLGAVWHLHADAPVDEAVSPLLHAADGAVAGDPAFRVPLAYVRAGTRAIAVLPDLDALARARRLPHALRIDAGPGSASILHAATGLRTELGAHTATTVRDPTASVRVRDEVVRVAHELAAFADARPDATVAALRAALWRRMATPDLLRSAGPLVDRPWHEIADAVLAERIDRDLRDARRRGADVALLVDPDASTDEVEIARLGAGTNMAADAVAIARVAVRRGDADLRATALRLGWFALLAPRRGGLTPHTFRLRLSDQHIEWIPGDPDGPRPDAFDAADAAATAAHLIDLAETLPELREPVHDAVAALCRFLRASQRADGALPGVYDREHLAPAWLDEDALAGATAGPAQILARFGLWSGDRDAIDAAARAVRFVHGRAVRAGGPVADPSRFHALLRDGTTGTPLHDLLPLAHAAAAAALLARREPSFGPFAADLLELLETLQQVWTPPWMFAHLTGGFGSSNADVVWNAAGQVTAARALFDGYEALGDRDLLERGAAALRVALAEPSPFVPGGRTRPDPLPHAAAAVALAEGCRTTFGQAVVDLAHGVAVGLDALWFEDVQLGVDRGQVRATTHAADLAAVDVRVRARAERVEVFDGGQPVLVGMPGFGIARPRRVPRFEFAPPASIAAGGDWWPRARVSGPLPAAGSTWVEILPGAAGPRAAAMSETEPVRVVLRLDPSDGMLVAAVPWRPEPQRRGEALQTRLVHETGNRRVTVPRDGFRAVRVEEFACIDPGDDLEAHLVESTAGTAIVRFVDGRENARAAEAGASFTYAVPVPADAAVAELRVVSSGALAIAGGPDGRALHEDQESVPRGDRTVALRLADPRLWPDGTLLLRFRPTGERAAVARIEYRTEGIAERALGGSTRELTAPDLRFELLVLPLALAGAVPPDAELLRQALLEVRDYRVTPEPEPRRTAGSLAQWIDVVSGGRTAVAAQLLDPLGVDEPLAALAEQDGWDEILTVVRPALSAAMQARTTAFDAVLVVHPGGPAHAPRDATIGSTPVIVVPEREADGSYLSLGRLARELLMRLRGLEDLGRPASGAFGELSLTASVANHTPPAPVGLNLVRTGWASLVDVTPDGARRPLRLPPLLEGRTVLRALAPAAAHAGALILESRRPTSPVAAVPEAPPPGLLVYRTFTPEDAPLVRLLDGRAVRPEIWRLSRSTPSLRTPFEPARGADLLYGASRLDDTAAPSLATPRGDTPWTIERIEGVGGGTTALDLRWHGVDLLLDTEHGFSGGVGTRLGPVVVGAADQGAGQVLADAGAATLIPPPRADGVLRGTFVHPLRAVARRLLIEVESVTAGRATLTIDDGGTRVGTFELPEAGAVVSAELPPGPARNLGLEIRTVAGSPAVRIGRAWTLPRSAGARSVTLPEVSAADVRLADGSFAAGVRGLRMDRRGRATVRVPLLAPGRHGVLRICCGAGHRDGATFTVRAVLRSGTGAEPRILLDGLTVAGAPDRDVPLTVALCELPDADARSVAFLELDVTGPPSGVLHLVTLEVDRL